MAFTGIPKTAPVGSISPDISVPEGMTSLALMPEGRILNENQSKKENRMDTKSNKTFHLHWGQ